MADSVSVISMKTRSGTGLSISLSLMVAMTPLLAVEKADVQSSSAATPDLALKADAEKRAAAHAHLITARMLEGEERMREALGHYLAFLQNDTGNPDLVAHIAELAMNYQGLDAAVKLLEEGIKANADRPEPYVNFVRFALTYGDDQNGLLSRSAALADEAVRRFPTNPDCYVTAVRLHLAESQREQGTGGKSAHLQAAENTLELAGKQNVEDPAYWLTLGRISMEVWPLADGEHRAEHLAKVNPFYEKAAQKAAAARDEDAELRTSDFYLFSNQLEKATAICEKVVKRSGILDARKRLVRLYDALEREDDSFKALQELVQAYPMDVEHRKLIASHYVQRAQNAARALKPEEAAKENAKAVEHLEAALQAGGGDLNDYLQISNLLRFTQDPDKFDQFTSRAQQLFPGEPRISWFRALSLGQLKKYAEAAKAYAESARLAETRAPEILDDQFHFSWGVALERSGQFEAAARQFQKSIDLTPNEDPPRAASAMNYLGYMWLDRGEHLDVAETLIRKANDMEPGNSAFVDSLGWLLFKQGKYTEALTELLRAEKLLRDEQPTPEPGDAEIYDHIAQTAEKLGQHDKALEYWKRALDVGPEVPAIRERAERALGVGKPPKPETPAEEKSSANESSKKAL